MGEKLAVVTGTTSGIGRQVAERLLADGWQVHGVARRSSVIEHSAYRHAQLDLGDLDALQRHFEQKFAGEVNLSGLERIGLVNNSAIVGPVGPLCEVPPAELLNAFAVNTVAPVWLTGFLLRRHGDTPLRIVNLSSAAATGAVAGWTGYCSTKAATRMASLVLAKEAEDYDDQASRMTNVAITVYDPASVNTDMQTHIRSHTEAQFPLLGRFLHLHEKGRLVHADVPAQEILEFLQGAATPVLTEKRRGA